MEVIENIPSYRIRTAIRRLIAALPNSSQRVYVEPYTMLSRERLTALEQFVREILRSQVPGDIVECGTAAGGSAALLALWVHRFGSKKKVYVYDTFEGLPSPTKDDHDYEKALLWTGQCRGNLEQVQQLFRQLNVLKTTVTVKGLFQDTLPKIRQQSVALLHLDGDWYGSTLTCLTHLWDLISPGGIVQIDDYGAWEGCRKTVDEFFASRSITTPLHVIDYTGRWVRKP